MHKGFKCLDIKTGRLYISRDVVFDEGEFPFAHLHPIVGAQLRKDVIILPNHLLNAGGVGCTDQFCTNPSHDSEGSDGIQETHEGHVQDSESQLPPTAATDDSGVGSDDDLIGSPSNKDQADNGGDLFLDSPTHGGVSSGNSPGSRDSIAPSSSRSRIAGRFSSSTNPVST